MGPKSVWSLEVASIIMGLLAVVTMLGGTPFTGVETCSGVATLQSGEHSAAAMTVRLRAM